MKSFNQYITEKPAKLSATLPYKGAKWDNFRGLENPTEKELIAFLDKSKYHTLRFLVDTKGKMWAWDANHGLHDAVVLAMTGKKYNGDYAKGTFGFFKKDDKDPFGVFKHYTKFFIKQNIIICYSKWRKKW